MISARVKKIALGILSGEVFFVAVVLLIVGISAFNASQTPTIPWFPLPLLVFIAWLVYAIDRKWDIGLAVPEGLPKGLIAGFAVTSMIASHAVLVLEGSIHGITKSFEAAPPGVSTVFAIIYWVAIVLAMSTASEAGYRGIMQSRLMQAMGVWPAIAIVAFMNLISHRFEGLFERTFGVIAILVAWGYLRHLSRSLTPTIITHMAAIFVWDIILFVWGPWDLDAMGMTGLSITAAAGLLGLWGAVYFAGKIRSHPGFNSNYFHRP